MPKIIKDAETSEYLKPFRFHGLDLEVAGEEAVGTCPWCGRDKFSVKVATGQWRCLICNEGKETEKAIKGGNCQTFITMLWERSYKQTRLKDYEELAHERKLLSANTLQSWNLAKSITTGNWLLPGYNSDVRLTGLYQFLKIGGRMAWLPTPTTGHRLLGMNLYNPQCNRITLLEGLWDASSYWEILGMVKDTDGKLVRTANRESSLASQESILGLASCQSFNEQWVHLFKGKEVWLLGQNDHEKMMCAGCRKCYSRYQHQHCPHCQSSELTGTIVAPASYNGMERISRLVSPVAEGVFIYNWGEAGFDPTLTSGFDIRDLLNV